MPHSVVLEAAAAALGVSAQALAALERAPGGWHCFLHSFNKPPLADLATRLPENEGIAPSYVKTQRKEVLVEQIMKALSAAIASAADAAPATAAAESTPPIEGNTQAAHCDSAMPAGNLSRTGASPASVLAPAGEQLSAKPKPAPQQVPHVPRLPPQALQAPKPQLQNLWYQPIQAQPLDSRLNTPQKVKIFKNLAGVPGLKRSEVLEAILAAPEADLSEDLVLSNILNNREGPLDPMLAAMKAQEDAMLDQAILESEKERDNIQARKRRRKDELLEGLKVPMAPAEEFQQSIWLHGLPGAASAAPATPASSSSDHSSGPGATLAVLVRDSVRGCGLIQLLVSVFDSCRSEDELLARSVQALSQTGPQVVIVDTAPLPDLLGLRRAVVDLLLMEAQTLKYYKDESHPFLLFVAHKFDSHVHADLRRAIHSRSAACEATAEALAALQPHCSAVLHLLRNEKYLFERGLAKIPTGGCNIPDIMRYQRLRPFMDLLRSRVDEDGFEFVEGKDGLELLSDADADVEEIASDEDSDSD